MTEDLVSKFQEQAKFWATSHQRFVSDEVLSEMPMMPREELDKLDYAVIKVDNAGLIEIFNAHASQLAGVSPQQAVGKNFFNHVAPCTNNRLFYGTFTEGVNADNLKVMFFYTLTYRISPLNVKVFLYRDPISKSNWILIQRS